MHMPRWKGRGSAWKPYKRKALNEHCLVNPSSYPVGKGLFIPLWRWGKWGSERRETCSTFTSSLGQSRDPARGWTAGWGTASPTLTHHLRDWRNHRDTSERKDGTPKSVPYFLDSRVWSSLKLTAFCSVSNFLIIFLSVTWNNGVLPLLWLVLMK